MQNMFHVFTTVFSISLFCVTVFTDDKSTPIVASDVGKLRGTILKSDEGLDFFAFRGIPYAKPPVKELRFSAPLPVDKWDGIFDATEDGPACIQFDFFTSQFTGDEDCLILNVYSPKLDAALPVLFFIHGGGYSSGSGMSSLYGPQRFMDKDVVLVTINYRLGVFGFLSTGDEASPGNYGMLDQVLALQWVKNNIRNFGGDPNQVTIFGESAGAASVMLHMASPLSKGLFHGAIPQSGAGISDWAFEVDLQTPRSNARKVAEQLGCPTDCNKKLVACLRKKAAVDVLVKAALVGMAQAQEEGIIIGFKPVIDETINGAKAFLPDNPKSLFQENKINAVPTMIGVTKDEGVVMLISLGDEVGGLKELHKEHIPKMLGKLAPYMIENKDRARKAAKLIDEYMENVDESNFKEKYTAFSDILGDVFMDVAAEEVSIYLAKHEVPTYMYMLTYRGMYTSVEKLAPQLTELKNRDWQLVSHADDLQYLFHSGYFPSTDLLDEDKKMADIMLTLWTNFAKTKVPTLDGSANDYSGFKWSPVTEDSVSYLNLTLKPKMVDGHLCERYDAWQEIIGTQGTKDEL